VSAASPPFAIVLLLVGGCGASQAGENTTAERSEGSLSPPSRAADEESQAIGIPSAEPTNPALRIELMRLERQARELERVASLVAEARESALHQNDTLPCEDGGAIESLRALGISGVAGASFALDAVNALQAWCMRRLPDPNPREQRRVLRALESELSRCESHARAGQRNLIEAADALRPVIGE